MQRDDVRQLVEHWVVEARVGILWCLFKVAFEQVVFSGDDFIYSVCCCSGQARFAAAEFPTVHYAQK